MAVSKRLRYEILRRDNHTCRYCGATAPGAKLTIDHVVPEALGGTDTPDNLVTACSDCNSGKTSSTPDATLVANVSDDAMRWATAMKQAAAEMEAEEGPKLQYRQAFLDAWNEWAYEYNGKRETFDLPNDWRSSVERYRLAGIPAVAWPDLIEPGMVNRYVKGPDTFRYTCGVANNRIKQLAERARQIVGVTDAPADMDSRKAVLETAFTVWHDGMSDNEDEPPSAQQADDFRRSLAEFSDWDLTEPGRIIAAAQYATYFGFSNISHALRDMDRDHIWRAWISSWPTTYVPAENGEEWGRFVGGPDDEAMEQVKEQIDKLLDADVYVSRIERAATHAGFHKSARIYCGLTEDELKATGMSLWRSCASELWRVAFRASSEREPSREETAQFFASLNRVQQDGEFYVTDVYIAASAAGSYQDPDITTCLPRHRSVFEAAAIPLQTAS